jgi:hypothetical protein
MTHMTLVEMKTVFDQVRKGAASIIKETKEKKKRIKKFQELWRSLFHSPVDAMGADAYLSVVEQGRTKKSVTRKAQKGGMAPVDFQTRPGIDGVHVSVPQYLTGGLGFYDTINKSGMFQDCGKVDITPVVPESIASNKFSGGGGTSPLTAISDALTLATTRPAESTVPASPIQNAQTIWLGQNPGASPRANQNPPKYI